LVTSWSIFYFILGPLIVGSRVAFGMPCATDTDCITFGNGCYNNNGTCVIGICQNGPSHYRGDGYIYCINGVSAAYCCQGSGGTANISPVSEGSAANCSSNPCAPSAPVCGNAVCESGEDCNNCAADCPCPGVTTSAGTCGTWQYGAQVCTNTGIGWACAASGSPTCIKPLAAGTVCTLGGFGTGHCDGSGCTCMPGVTTTAPTCAGQGAGCACTLASACALSDGLYELAGYNSFDCDSNHYCCCPMPATTPPLPSTTPPSCIGDGTAGCVNPSDCCNGCCGGGGVCGCVTTSPPTTTPTTTTPPTTSSTFCSTPGVCQAGETCSNCPADCGVCPTTSPPTTPAPPTTSAPPSSGPPPVLPAGTRIQLKEDSQADVAPK